MKRLVRPCRKRFSLLEQRLASKRFFVLSVLLVILGLTLPTQLLSQTQTPPAGDLSGQDVIVVAKSTPIRLAGETLGSLAEGSIVRVGKQRDNWLWITNSQGYIQAKDAIPITQGLAHYDGQLQNAQANSTPSESIFVLRGNLHFHQNHYDLANADYSEAVRLKPDLAIGWIALGKVSEALGSMDKAREHFQKAVETGTRPVLAFRELAQFLMRQKEMDSAISNLQKAIDYLEKLSRQNSGTASTKAQWLRVQADLHSDWGWCLTKQDSWEEALVQLNQAVELKPNDYFILGRRRVVLRHFKRFGEIRSELETAVAKQGVHPATINEYAHFLATCIDDPFRDGTKALELAQKICNGSDSENPEYLDTLAAAFAETGDFENAIKSQTTALALADPKSKDDFQSRLTKYQNHQPHRE